MFERFTERARKVIVAAQNQAQHFNHDYIGTEHILLGLLHEKGGGRGTGFGAARRHLRESA